MKFHHTDPRQIEIIPRQKISDMKIKAYIIIYKGKYESSYVRINSTRFVRLNFERTSFTT